MSQGSSGTRNPGLVDVIPSGYLDWEASGRAFLGGSWISDAESPPKLEIGVLGDMIPPKRLASFRNGTQPASGLELIRFGVPG